MMTVLEICRIAGVVLVAAGLFAWGVSAVAMFFRLDNRLSDWAWRCCCFAISLGYAIHILIAESVSTKIVILLALILWLIACFAGSLKPRLRK